MGGRGGLPREGVERGHQVAPLFNIHTSLPPTPSIHAQMPSLTPGHILNTWLIIVQGMVSRAQPNWPSHGHQLLPEHTARQWPVRERGEQSLQLRGNNGRVLRREWGRATQSPTLLYP